MLSPARWTVVIPVKSGPGAKSRLARSIPPALTDAAPTLVAELAAAFVQDVLTATQHSHAISDVVLVTNQPQARAAAHDIRAACVADPGGGLQAAIHAGVAATPPGRPIAVLLGDLPALRGRDLDAALAAAEASFAAGASMAVLPDADHTGSVLLAAAAPQQLIPAFGADSLNRHRQLGASVLSARLPRMQRDVDSVENLLAALALGCGAATRAVLESHPQISRIGSPEVTCAPSAAMPQ